MEKIQSGYPLPGLQHQDLLKASLLKGSEMQAAYQSWRGGVDFEMEVESASIRLLPLLYNNIKQAEIEDSILARLKGIYRKRWSESNMFFYNFST